MQPDALLAAGAVVFVAAKALKYWAIATLGHALDVSRPRPAGLAAASARGPYRWIAHPNYVAVALELLGAPLALHACVTGPIAVAGFCYLMWRRVRIEEKALAGRVESPGCRRPIDRHSNRTNTRRSSERCACAGAVSRGGSMPESGAPRLPFPVRAADAAAVAFAWLAIFVLSFGGFVLQLGPIPLRVHVAGRLLFMAVALAAIRHAAHPADPLHRRIARGLRASGDESAASHRARRARHARRRARSSATSRS